MSIPMQFKKLADKNVKCLACEQGCIISEGRKGICGIRKNVGGELQLLTYGYAIADGIDPIEKKPLYHFLPSTEIYSIATVGCNFRCEFCQNAHISQLSKIMDSVEGFSLPPKTVVSNAIKHRCPSIAYTYTEPTVFFEYTYDTIELAREKGLKNVYVSNGYFTENVFKKLNGKLDAINIDLKSFSKEFYTKVCGAKLEMVLRNIELVAKSKIWLEITTLLIPGYNDSEGEIRNVAEFIASLNPLIPWHISRFYPAYKMEHVPVTPLKTLLTAYDIGIKAGLKYVYIGNAPQLHKENTFCHACGTLLIKRNNYFVTFEHLRDGKCLNCGTETPGVLAGGR